MASINIKPIDLVFTAKQIALSGKKLQAQIESTGNSVDIPAKSLLAKIPTLKVFESDTAIIRVGKFEDSFYGQTLALYLSDDDKIRVYSPSLDWIEDCEIVSYTAGFNGIATIKKGGELFIIDFPMSDYHEENIETLKKVEGEGVPPIELVKKVPHPMANWCDLNRDEIYSIVDKTTPFVGKDFTSERWLIEDSKGNQFEVFENASLRKIVSEFGTTESFKIGDIRSKKDGTKKVELIAQSTDYSEFTV
ncbi:MAG: hypothetical protein ACRCU2_16840 [Planktothrix sp.]